MNMELIYKLVLLLLSHITARSQQGPEIVGEINNDVARLGSSATLSCIVANQQTTNPVQWFFLETETGGELISSNENILVNNSECKEGMTKYDVRKRETQNHVTYTLVVNCLETEDEGRYMCFILIPGVRPLDLPLKTGRIIVQSPPVITSVNDSVVEVDIGQSVTLFCAASGTPIPNVTWVRADGSLLKLPSGGSAVLRSRTLLLDNVKKDDSGLYRCVADNQVPPAAEYQVKILVSFQPETSAVRMDIGITPDRQLDAKLECRISGHPVPGVIWLMQPKNNTDNIMIQLNSNERYIMKQTATSAQFGETFYSSLTIKDITRNDMGTYSCKAQNKIGTNNSTVIELFQCHDTCKSTCWQTGPKGCDECKTGWIKSENDTCVECHQSCSDCSGSGADQCIECSSGYILRNGTCTEDTECKGPNCPSSEAQRTSVISLTVLLVPVIASITNYWCKTQGCWR